MLMNWDNDGDVISNNHIFGIHTELCFKSKSELGLKLFLFFIYFNKNLR